jgi:hypothetical protein
MRDHRSATRVKPFSRYSIVLQPVCVLRIGQGKIAIDPFFVFRRQVLRQGFFSPIQFICEALVCGNIALRDGARKGPGHWDVVKLNARESLGSRASDLGLNFRGSNLDFSRTYDWKTVSVTLGPLWSWKMPRITSTVGTAHGVIPED